MDNESVNVLVLGVYGALAGGVLALFGRIFSMIFWETMALDLPTLALNVVCGAALGAALVTLVALIFNAFGQRRS